MNGADFHRDIDDDLWNDIQDIFDGDQQFADDISQVFSLQFGTQIASGFRFRYQSEIDKKSFSSIKGEGNKTPTIKINSTCDLTLRIDLVTEKSSCENQSLHFNTLYEIAKEKKYGATIFDGFCQINISKNCPMDIKLDFLGIRKWKLKEAIPRIIEMYPELSEAKAKQFYNENKETVKLRALLLDEKCIFSSIVSDTIKSQNAKENKEIKIQHISPKTIADYGETLIIILEKKVTSDCSTYLEFATIKKLLNPIYQDGQTFVYGIPDYTLTGPIMAKIRIQCSDREDCKPIRFVPAPSELRKRKSPHYESGETPLKKPTNYDSPQELYPETGIYDGSEFSNIEFDGPHSMDFIDTAEDVVTLPPAAFHISSNESCKDSGIGRLNDRSSQSSDSENDCDSSFDESDDESDVIEIEGVRRRPVNRVGHLETINFPTTKRVIESHLEPNTTDKVANKIFSEVARIGHDFAFGKEPGDLFLRIAKQLPVVFTLQDDVGDSPLNNAILKGNPSHAERILQIVYDECKWALNLTNSSGHTALILAPACDVPASFITKLLNAGCRLDIYDDLGKTAITYAIEYKNKDALMVLLDYVKENNKRDLLLRNERVYFSYLQIAVMNGFLEGVKMLLSLKDNNSNYMVDVNELALMNDDTALHIAVERGAELQIVELLLDRPDIDINHKKDKATAVLDTAQKMKLNGVVELLLAHGAKEIHEVVDNDEILDSVDDIDDNDTDAMTCDASQFLDMTPEEGHQAVNVITLTAKMESMSLKGETRQKLINLIINEQNGLSVQELSSIVKPSFQTLISKFKTISGNFHEIIDTLDRFNCLPNSVGELCKKLREIERVDLIQKVVDHFSY